MRREDEGESIGGEGERRERDGKRGALFRHRLRTDYTRIDDQWLEKQSGKISLLLRAPPSATESHLFFSSRTKPGVCVFAGTARHFRARVSPPRRTPPRPLVLAASRIDPAPGVPSRRDGRVPRTPLRRTSSLRDGSPIPRSLRTPRVTADSSGSSIARRDGPALRRPARAGRRGVVPPGRRAVAPPANPRAPREDRGERDRSARERRRGGAPQSSRRHRARTNPPGKKTWSVVRV